MKNQKEPEKPINEQGGYDAELTNSELAQVHGGKIRNNTVRFDCPPGLKGGTHDCDSCVHRNECSGANNVPEIRDVK